MPLPEPLPHPAMRVSGIVCVRLETPLLVDGAAHSDAALVDAAGYQVAVERSMPLSPARALATLYR